MVAKPRGGSSGLRLCVPCFYDSDAPHCSPSEHAPLSIRLRSALPAFRSRPPRSKDHALVRTDHLRPQSQASRANVMNVAGRRCGESCDPSNVRTNAQSRADIESVRAWIPYMPELKFSPATVMRTGVLLSKSTRFHAAYGQHRPQPRALHRSSSLKSPALRTDRPGDAGFLLTATPVAGPYQRHHQTILLFPTDDPPKPNSPGPRHKRRQSTYVHSESTARVDPDVCSRLQTQRKQATRNGPIHQNLPVPRGSRHRPLRAVPPRRTRNFIDDERITDARRRFAHPTLRRGVCVSRTGRQ